MVGKIIPRAVFSLNDKSILDYLCLLFELFDLKNFKKSPNWKARNHQFSKKWHFPSLNTKLLPNIANAFVSEHVLQITDRHIYTMSNAIYIVIKKKKKIAIFGLTYIFQTTERSLFYMQRRPNREFSCDVMSRNFPSHHAPDRHVGFLFTRRGTEKYNKMCCYFLFSLYHNTN